MNLYLICIQLVFYLPSLPPKHSNICLFLLWYMPSYIIGTIHMYNVFTKVQEYNCCCRVIKNTYTYKYCWSWILFAFDSCLLENIMCQNNENISNRQHCIIIPFAVNMLKSILFFHIIMQLMSQLLVYH